MYLLAYYWALNATVRMTSSATNDANLAIYIPRIDTRSLPRFDREEVVKEFIAAKFHEGAIGKVSRVDLLKKNDPKGFVFYVAFCHFEEWYDTEEARSLQKDIKDPDTKAKFQFHTKWFWIINENTKPISDEDAKLNRIIRDHERTISSLKYDLGELRRLLIARDEQIAHMMRMMAPTAHAHPSFYGPTDGYRYPRGESRMTDDKRARATHR